MGPIAAGADIKVVLQNIAARLPLGLHLDVAGCLARSQTLDPRIEGKDIVVEIGAQVQKTVATRLYRSAKSGSII